METYPSLINSLTILEADNVIHAGDFGFYDRDRKEQ